MLGDRHGIFSFLILKDTWHPLAPIRLANAASAPLKCEPETPLRTHPARSVVLVLRTQARRKESAPIRLACSYASCQRRLIAATASQSDRTKGNAASASSFAQARRKE